MSLNLRIVFTALAALMALAGQVNAVDLLYVTNYAGNSIGKYGTDGSILNTSFITNSIAAGPTDIISDRNMNLYVSNWLSGKIVRTDSAGLNGSTFLTLGSRDRFMAFDSQGNFFTNNYIWPSGAQSSTETISKYDANGNLINSSYILIPAGYRNISGFTIDSQNNMFVNYEIPDGAANKKHLIAKYDSIGNLVNGNYVTGLGANTGDIAFDKHGNMLVVDWNIVRKYDSLGNYLGIIANNQGGNKGGIGIALDSDDNIYLTNMYGNSISKFTFNGSLVSQSFITGLNNPWRLTIQPTTVPEPSTYALGLIASGALAAIAKRRKARQIINA